MEPCRPDTHEPGSRHHLLKMTVRWRAISLSTCPYTSALLAAINSNDAIALRDVPSFASGVLHRTVVHPSSSPPSSPDVPSPPLLNPWTVLLGSESDVRLGVRVLPSTVVVLTNGKNKLVAFQSSPPVGFSTSATSKAVKEAAAVEEAEAEVDGDGDDEQQPPNFPVIKAFFEKLTAADSSAAAVDKKSAAVTISLIPGSTYLPPSWTAGDAPQDASSHPFVSLLSALTLSYFKASFGHLPGPATFWRSAVDPSQSIVLPTPDASERGTCLCRTLKDALAAAPYLSTPVSSGDVKAPPASWHVVFDDWSGGGAGGCGLALSRSSTCAFSCGFKINVQNEKSFCVLLFQDTAASSAPVKVPLRLAERLLGEGVNATKLLGVLQKLLLFVGLAFFLLHYALSRRCGDEGRRDDGADAGSAGDETKGSDEDKLLALLCGRRQYASGFAIALVLGAIGLRVVLRIDEAGRMKAARERKALQRKEARVQTLKEGGGAVVRRSKKDKKTE